MEYVQNVRSIGAVLAAADFCAKKRERDRKERERTNKKQKGQTKRTRERAREIT